MKVQTAVSQIERTYTTKGRLQSGLFSVEGVRLNERALRAGVPLETAVVSATLHSAPAPRETALLTALQALDVPLVVVPDETLLRLTSGRSLGGIISLLRIPMKRPLRAIVQGITSPLLLAAVDVVDPGNVGAMMRTAHGLGCDAFLLVGRSDPYHPKTVRTSMGSIFKLPIATYTNADELLGDLANLRITTLGTAVDAALLLPQLALPKGGVALLMGSEYHGLPSQLCKRLDFSVSIPMAQDIDSLSINAATAVALYELRARREPR